MSEVTYEAPGPGTWELETTHFQKPVSAYTQGLLAESLARGLRFGTERYGLLLSHLQMEYVNGFCYMQPRITGVPPEAPPGPPPDGFFEQPELLARFESGARAIENRAWREDLKRWDEEVKPDSIRRNRALQEANPSGLDDAGLACHLVDCYENLQLMWFRHHEFTVPAIMPTGLYLASVCEWSGATPGETLELLKGSSPVSTGLAADELDRIARLLRQQGEDGSRFTAMAPAKALQVLCSLPGEAGEAIRDYLDIVGYQLTSGYDITERYALEAPEVLVANICSVLDRAEDDSDESAFETNKQAMLDRIPAEHHAEFEDLLAEARLVNRLRDERGVYNEARAFGLTRRAVLEAGARMQARGVLDDAELLVLASHEEMLAMLAGEGGPGQDELRRRQAWHHDKTIDDPPPFLGPPPSPPPPLEALPEVARRAEAALGAVMGNLFAAPLDGTETSGVVEGLPVSPGVYEGTARVVDNPSDFHRLQSGDVLVTRNTSATFNVVLPMLGAIVTDRGGQLSHAAIVAREYGIPGIVSARNASSSIPDGARVRVDGGAGRIEVLS